MPSDQQSTVTSGSIYDPSRSSTYQEMTGFNFSLGYADGSGASGPAAMDTVNIGGATVPNMPFGVCSDLRYGGGGSGSRDTDGPVGLGFGVENSIRPTPQCTFMECLEPYVPEPVFSTAFKTNNSGFIDFGYADSAAYTGNLTTIPIANTSSGNEGQWVYQGAQFGSGGQVFSAAAIDLDFDSGTSSLSVSADIASAYFGLIEGSSNSSGSWQYPCGSTLPDLDFIFNSANSGPNTVTIPGANLKNGDASTGDCGTWMNVVTGRGNAGIPFYISKYMIWNQSVPTLSFADQVN
ncbi:aspartic peptidase domain-containing protein [Talaromyces proteolyticus]|uniref:Aspartic peptidase domain-containing protein n=1 Tax=Talaromyces proteolyticus TaxID=1131652 RepID=A0AAD4Q724_9EURO|nr:aspartic peptidase domain-containing protein [Talaromyces proteolyticus]KAH8705912.1 aspartic peptidase domain-containing protein [Talaromyces proteolyticus]